MSAAAEELVGLTSIDGAVFRVHKWLLINTSNVFRELLSSVPEDNIKLTENAGELLLLLRALYGASLMPPEGEEGHAIDRRENQRLSLRS